MKSAGIWFIFWSGFETKIVVTKGKCHIYYEKKKIGILRASVSFSIICIAFCTTLNNDTIAGKFNPLPAHYQNDDDSNSIQNPHYLDSTWHYLVFVKGGCLVGGQYIRRGDLGAEGCVINIDEDWVSFLKNERKELANFLLSRIAQDTTETAIHTCPFMNAVEGEIAVYVLQNLYQFNWFDFKEFKEYKNREMGDDGDNAQNWLQEIIADEERRNVLINCWRKKIESYRN